MLYQLRVVYFKIKYVYCQHLMNVKIRTGVRNLENSGVIQVKRLITGRYHRYTDTGINCRHPEYTSLSDNFMAGCVAS